MLALDMTINVADNQAILDDRSMKPTNTNPRAATLDCVNMGVRISIYTVGRQVPLV